MGTTQIKELPSGLPEQFSFTSKTLSDASTFFDAYFIFSANTEVPIIFHRWAAITGIGALLARNFYLPFGSKNIYPNNYCLFIGDPGTRKSTAIDTLQDILAKTGYNTFAADKTSKEKLLLDLEAGPIGDDLEGSDSSRKYSKDAELVMKNLFGDTSALDEVHPMFIVADEYKDFAGQNNLDLATMLGKLWDNKSVYKSRIKNGKSISISKPIISILGGATHETFASCFPPEAIGTGFLSRLLLVFGESSGKKIPRPTVPNSQDTKFLVDWLIRIRDTVQGEAILSTEASSALDTIYLSWVDLEDSRFRHYSTRRHTHLIKLCLILAASRLSTNVSLEDVILANSILSFTERLMPRALGEFGRAKNSGVAGKILTALHNATTPMSLVELYKVISTEVERFRDVPALLEGLLQAEKIIATPQGFLPKTATLKQNQPFVDFSMLPEFYLS